MCKKARGLGRREFVAVLASFCVWKSSASRRSCSASESCDKSSELFNFEYARNGWGPLRRHFGSGLAGESKSSWC